MYEKKGGKRVTVEWMNESKRVRVYLSQHQSEISTATVAQLFYYLMHAYLGTSAWMIIAIAIAIIYI